MGEGLSGWVAAHRQAILNSEAALDLGERASTGPGRLESGLNGPLISGESIVGALTIYSRERNGFSDDHGRLLQVIRRT